MKLVTAKRAVEADDNALERFGSESDPAPVVRRAPRRLPAVVLIIVCVLLLGAGVAVASRRGLLPLSPRVATINIDSTPAGAEVFVGGASKGRTPLSFTAAAGQYGLEVVSNGQRVPLQVSAAGGAIISHHVRFAPAAAPAAAPLLLVSTDPAHLRVSVDDVDRGVSPVRVAGLTAGNHRIHVDAPGGALVREVELHDSESLSVVMAAGHPADPATVAGWISVASPLPLHIVENGQVVGTSDASRIMLAAGSHDLQLVNEEAGFRESRRVTVTAGKSTALRIDVPNGRISINAVPWADVWIDAQHVGETPIGNFSVPVGQHRVTFRHPQLGERQERVTVTTRDVARTAVDFTRR